MLSGTHTGIISIYNAIRIHIKKQNYREIRKPPKVKFIYLQPKTFLYTKVRSLSILIEYL
jgi:hypothetical protein